MHHSAEEALLQAAKLVQAAESIIVLSGAGLSKASGIPTYRDERGLWQKPENLQYSHVDSYRKNPTEFVRFWNSIVERMLDARPNPGHFALRRLQQCKPNTLLITQNVDGLLQQAGCTDVIELHGSLRRSRCEQCGLCCNYLSERCLRCGAGMRPAVILFGELLEEHPLKRAQSAAAGADLVIVVGTTAEVYPAAALPSIALEKGAKLIVLDTVNTALAELADIVLLGPSETLLPALMDCSI